MGGKWRKEKRYKFCELFMNPLKCTLTHTPQNGTSQDL